MLGGRAAESLVFNEMTTGASDDITKATEVARMMVTEYGMSDLGPLNLSTDPRMPYEQSPVSEDMSAKIDTQVKKITDEGYREAVAILGKLRKKLDVLAEKLLQKETLEAEEFEKLIGSKPATVPVKA
jgi:cell division protease FtsH